MDTQELQELIDVAVESEDQTDVTSGDFTYEIQPEGITAARFISYVELGSQKQRAYKGKDRPAAQEVRIGFELLSPKHIKEIEVDGDTKEITNKFFLRVTKKLNKRASYYKLFQKMTYGRDDITHMAQMLGEAFVLTLYHKTTGEGDDKRTYVNLKAEGGDFDIGAPFVEDALTGDTTDVPVPPAREDLKIFLWDNPTAETWGSLFIDGTRPKKNAKGEEEEVSKNWLQEVILEATNFTGSALEDLLAGAEELEDVTQAEDEEVEEEVEEVAEVEEKPKTKKKAAPKKAAKKAPVKKKVAPKSTEVEEDPLVALGLIAA